MPLWVPYFYTVTSYTPHEVKFPLEKLWMFYLKCFPQKKEKYGTNILDFLDIPSEDPVLPRVTEKRGSTQSH